MTAGEPLITLVTDRRQLSGRALPDLVRQAARAGVDFVQIREKDLPGGALRQLAAECLAAATGTPARVIVNGRPDVAFVVGAAGVQLPEDGLPVADVKRAFPRLLVGASRHSVEGARQAEDEGADFVVLGPIFPTPGKEDRALGVGALSEAARLLRIPVHAIGGIDRGSARPAVEAGARGLAAIRIFLEGAPEAVLRGLREDRTA